ncbi:nitric oxide synthase [Elysia marginata]|uniref:Nitric oxide synthase n=1 Tax=Elysia marginata TaxID=1093978 RepID=A0AAV4HH84_9GAST|nr:nitric oxide synthase [Elysia marginata]
MPSTSVPGDVSPNTIRVKLVKQSYGGLGFLVKQRTLKPFVLVASIVKGGVAEESGLVQTVAVMIDVVAVIFYFSDVAKGDRRRG